MSARILVADDEDSLRWVLEKGLHQAGYEVTAVKDGAAAVRAVEAEPFDVVLLDVRMPGMDGLTALGKMRELRPTASIVVMTAHGTMETAIQAMQRGAYDYLTKPFDLDEVLLLAQRALEAGRLTQEVTRLKTGMQEVREFSALIGRHARMQDVYKTIGRIAGSDVTVLLRGESGTGKELVARAIHHYSRRAGRPFVAVSCAAIPGTLLESEMAVHSHALEAVGGFAGTNNDPTNGVPAKGDAGLLPYTPSGALLTMAFQAIAPAGGSLPHNNMMPYLVLNYCIALQGVFPGRS